MTTSVEELRAQGAISPVDGYFARSMARIAGDDRPEVLIAAALASRQAAQGDVCVDLGRVTSLDGGEPVALPPLAEWLDALSSSPLVGGASSGADSTPLVLDAKGRLYLRRLFEDERLVAEGLGRRAEGLADLSQPAAARESIERLLPLPEGSQREIHWPRVAAAVVLAKRLCVIAGRPGTGKTTTAARLLAVLVESALRAGRPPPRIALAAPTGKAAARLALAIAGEMRRMDCAEAVREAIPGEASTLHRLLGVDGRSRVRDAGESRAKLRADVVLVDEASMVDLSLMSRLVAMLPDAARLIALGDADQLASVEAGAVFADLCGPRRAPEYGAEVAAWIAGASGQSPWLSQARAPGIADCVVRLETSYRYDEASGIGRLARAVQAGDADTALGLLEDPAIPDVSRVDHDGSGRLTSAVLAGYAAFAAAAGPGDKLAALDRFRVLCAVREGPFGVVAASQAAERALDDAGLLPARGRAPAVAAEGRPVLVTRNAPHLGLYNGDVGVLSRAGGNRLRAFFGDASGELRSFGSSRLPEHELVFAMSVHKSQGSEFDEVALVLPPGDAGAPLPLLTRELVYTAVTRARRRVAIHGSADVLRAAIERRVARASGLRDGLWGSASRSAAIPSRP